MGLWGTAHLTRPCLSKIHKERVFYPLCHTHSIYPGVKDYPNTHYPLCILQLRSFPQDLATVFHAVRSPRHVHPNIQPTLVERAVQRDDSQTHAYTLFIVIGC